MERLCAPLEGQAFLFSTWDRTGGNVDFFDPEMPHKEYIKQTSNGKWIVFKQDGPGVIERIWSAMPPSGGIHLYFDGSSEPDMSWGSTHKFFADNSMPFVKPLAVNFLGGWFTYVPIPFEKGLKIVTDYPPGYLQFSWRKLPHSSNIDSFISNQSPFDTSISQRLLHPMDEYARLSNASEDTSSVHIQPQAIHSTVNLTGPGILRSLKITLEPDDENYGAIGQETALRIYIDGRNEPNVEVGLDDFFCDPFGLGQTKSFPIGSQGNTRYCNYPMPFQKSLRIELANESKQSIELSCGVRYTSEKLPEKYYEFFAHYHRDFATTDRTKPFTIFKAQGEGHFVGTSLVANSGGRGVGYLEGDELFAIDGRSSDQYNGTGMEDYFNGGWYFVMGHTGSSAFNGVTYIETDHGLAHMYRMHFTDPVNFKESADLELEHGTENSHILDMACVSYFYATPDTKTFFEPLLPASDRLLREKPGKNSESIDMTKLRNKWKKRRTNYIPQTGGYGLVSISDTAPNTINYPIQVPETGKWNLRATFGQATSCGYYYALLDGKRLPGTSFDCSVPYPTLAMTGNMTMISGQELTAGPHTVTIVSTDPPGGRNKEGINQKLDGYDIFVQALALERVDGQNRPQ